MSATQPSTQNAAERRQAEAALRALIAKHSPAHARLVGAARRGLRKRLPSAHEVVYEYRGFFVISYSPTEHGYEGVLALHAGRDGVRLYFQRGKELPDPAKLLQGSARARWMSLVSASALARPDVSVLIDEAMAANRVPCAGAGRGSVVVRPTSASASARRRSGTTGASTGKAAGTAKGKSRGAAKPRAAKRAGKKPAAKSG